MSIPNPHAIVLLAITIAAFWLYTRPWARIEYVSLGLLATLLVLFYAFPYVDRTSRLDEVEIFRALGHPALVAICCLMVLGRGLTMTGALEPGVRVLLLEAQGLARDLSHPGALDRKIRAGNG